MGRVKNAAIEAAEADTAKSYAEEGLEDLSNEYIDAEQDVNANANGTSNEEEFVQVGGLEPVKYYWRTSAPKKDSKSPFKIFEKGQTIIGTFVRTFTSGRYKNPTYLIKMDNGDVTGLAGTGSLNKAMARLAEGSRVKITYDGMKPIQQGEFKGTDAHMFTVLGNKLRAEQD